MYVYFLHLLLEKIKNKNKEKKKKKKQMHITSLLHKCIVLKVLICTIHWRF